MNDIDILLRLVDVDTFTAADKAQLVPLLEQYGVEKPKNTRCKSCWRDAAIMALREARKGQPRAEGLPVLRGDAGSVGVIWKGRLVSNAVMTEELAAWLSENGFPEKYYER